MPPLFTFNHSKHLWLWSWSRRFFLYDRDC